VADPAPVIVFGAFDRHNFGDLLFAHIAASLLKPRPVVFAGLAERDLTSHGGHHVHAIADLAREWGGRPAHLVHAGGETLTCSLYEAAVMLQRPEDAKTVIDLYDSNPMASLDWAQRQTGLRQRIGYMVPKDLFQNPGCFLYTGVGGAPLPHLPETERQEVLARLREAEFISVRDRTTQGTLASHGIQADLVPDPAVLTAALFAPLIKTHRENGEPAAVREHFPQGYVAVQFSADFGDDATLRDLARQLTDLALDTACGIVLFRAGAAPWHDDLEVYRRLAGFMPETPSRVFESLNLWDICALLSSARAYCGSSLHGRIVAEAFGVPGIHLLRTGQGPGKLAAYASTWSPEALATIVATDDAVQRLQAIDAGQVLDAQELQVRLARQTSVNWLAVLKD